MRTPASQCVLGPVWQLSPTDPDYPRPLCDLPDPPALLEGVGTLPDWSQAVAIVGTRSPTSEAAQLARQLGRELAEAGWLVVSGGARGIDSEAHAGALEAGGVTVVVLGGPVHRPYPRENVPLFRQVVEAGCVLSEVLVDDTMVPARFVQRNRIIAALSQKTVVVQAPYESGALSTAAAARKLARPILVVPYTPWDPAGAGCLELLAKGAAICRGSRDVLLLSAAGTPLRPARKPTKSSGRPEKVPEYQGLDEDERALVEALGRAPLAADELCQATGLSAPRVQRAILMLLLSKVIHEVGSGRYKRADYR